MKPASIWTLIIGLSILTMMLRSSFVVFLGKRKLPEIWQCNLRYVSVGILPGMVAGLIAFPASMNGQTNAVWLGASAIAVATGMIIKNPVVIMGMGAAGYILLELLI